MDQLPWNGKAQENKGALNLKRSYWFGNQFGVIED